MKRLAVWTLVATVAIAGFAAGRGFSQDAKDGPPAGGPSAEDMQKMMEMGQPAEENKKLAATAGTWDAEMKMWMDPSQPPVETKGVSTRRAAMNGLYVLAEHKSEFMGQPFEGFGVDGYSKEKGKYFSFWADCMGTTPMMLWGTADASGKKVTYEGELYACPMGAFTPRIAVSNDDADHMSMEMWQKKEGATDWTKVMEIKYTRKK